MDPDILKTPVELAHFFWSHLLKPGSIALDATCGNGHDTLYLASKVLSEGQGHVYGLDIQKKAIESTWTRLKQHLEKSQLDHITLQCASHEDLSFIDEGSLDLAVYNLGYLPGADHEVTTMTQTTLRSLDRVITKLKNGAYLSITCYPGHGEGAQETHEVVLWTKALPKSFRVCQHKWMNRSERSPFLLLIQKS